MKKYLWIIISAIVVMFCGGGGLQAQEAAEQLDDGAVLEESVQDNETQNTGDEQIEDDVEVDPEEAEGDGEAEEEEKKPVRSRVVNMNQRITL
ncbi:MAG: hypothetical protein KAR07_12650, partial [Spirochaetes bacterium]|nr:hypothetical protein [Spirochaetota bacterium]